MITLEPLEIPFRNSLSRPEFYASCRKGSTINRYTTVTNDKYETAKEIRRSDVQIIIRALKRDTEDSVPTWIVRKLVGEHKTRAFVLES
jgi:hypothetical protein